MTKRFNYLLCVWSTIIKWSVTSCNTRHSHKHFFLNSQLSFYTHISCNTNPSSTSFIRSSCCLIYTPFTNTIDIYVGTCRFVLLFPLWVNCCILRKFTYLEGSACNGNTTLTSSRSNCQRNCACYRNYNSITIISANTR